MTDAFGTKRVLVTGATGKQGGAVVKALLASPQPFEILALTRNTKSKSAQALASKPNVKVIAGDLDDVDAIFESVGGKNSVWGVFLITMPSMKKLKEGVVDKEVKQGTSLFDAAQENGVKHFVFSSVDRGGDVKSWDTPTKIPHFITKHQIELHIRDKINTSQMSYTIIRPVAFMDNEQPGQFGRLFAAMWAQMGNTKLQLVATKDIGVFAAKALANAESDDFKNQAISIAGDSLTQAEANEVFWTVLKRPMVQSYWVLAYLLKWVISDVGVMFKWFEDDGYGADLEKCKRLNPELLNFETWVKEESYHK